MSFLKKSSWSRFSLVEVSSSFRLSMLFVDLILLISSWFDYVWVIIPVNSVVMICRIRFSRMRPSTVIGFRLIASKNSLIVLMAFACIVWLVVRGRPRSLTFYGVSLGLLSARFLVELSFEI